MTTLENRTQPGAGAHALHGIAFGEAMAGFLENNQINHDLSAPDIIIETVTVVSEEGKSSKVSGCSGGESQELFARKVFARLERYVRYGSRLLPVETREACVPHLLVGIRLKVTSCQNGWAVARLPEIADMTFAEGERVEPEEMAGMLLCAKTQLEKHAA